LILRLTRRDRRIGADGEEVVGRELAKVAGRDPRWLVRRLVALPMVLSDSQAQAVFEVARRPAT